MATWARKWGTALAWCGLWLGARAEDAPVAQAAVVAEGWSLDQLLALAQENNPDLAAARAQADSARGRLLQAGLYPNPTFTWEAEDVNSPGNAAGAQGPILGQQFITAGKRRLAMRAAEAGVSMADWQAVTRWYDILTRVRLAYYDLATAEREVLTHEQIVGIAKEALDAAQKLFKAGTGTRPDVLRAQVELAEHGTRLAVARQRRIAAWKMLAVVVGMSDLEARPLQEKLEAQAPGYAWEATLAQVLQRSSEVQSAQSAILQAEQLFLRARAERVPDVKVEVRPLYNFPDKQTELTAMIGFAVPILDRNQGNIAAAHAEVSRTLAESRAVELRLTDRLAAAYERYQSARQLVAFYEGDPKDKDDQGILRNAQMSLDLIRKGYEAGDAKYDFTSVLQSQRTLAQARLDYVRALGQLWKAVSEIRGLIQDGDCPWRGPCR